MLRSAAIDHENVVRFPGAGATADDALTALTAFADDLDRALDGPFEDDGDARALWVALLDATRKLCQRRELDRAAGAFAVLETMLAELDHGHAPTALQPKKTPATPTVSVR
jgi:hypothetical protein